MFHETMSDDDIDDEVRNCVLVDVVPKTNPVQPAERDTRNPGGALVGVLERVRRSQAAQ